MTNNHSHKQPSLPLLFYVMGGAVSTAIHYIFSCILFYLLDASALISNATAFLLASLFSFFWHRKYTFKSNVKFQNGYVKFILIGLLGLAISQSIMWICYHQLGIRFLWAQVWALIIIPPITFTLNRTWTYKTAVS